MALYPAHKKRNLEEIDREIKVGPWRISFLADPIREKRFLLFNLRSRSLSGVAPSVILFRSEAARLIAPSLCAHVLSTTIDGDRIDILTDGFDLLTPARADERHLEEAVDTILRTLALFEEHHFFANNLFPQFVGQDQAGNWMLLPPAYALPVPVDERIAPSQSRRRSPVRPSNVSGSFVHPPEAERDAYHTGLLGEFIARCSPRPSRTAPQKRATSFHARLMRAADAITRGETSSISEAYEQILGRRLDTSSHPFAQPKPPARHVDEIDRLMDRVSIEGSVTVITGRPNTGKSHIIRETALRLDGTEDYDVFTLDEWDLFGKQRSRLVQPARTTPKGRAAPRYVWMIDDIDEKTLVCSGFSKAMMESESFPRGAVVLGVRSAGASKETTDFLARLEAQRGDRYQKIEVAEAGSAGLNGLIESVLERLPQAPKTGDQKQIDALLRSLNTEEKQLLEFVAVARFALPLDIILSVFPETEQKIPLAVCRLVSLDILEEMYRQSSPKSRVTMFLRVKSAGLRRLVYGKIPRARRKKLHRTAALFADELGGFPTYFLLYHCLKAESPDLAAQHLVRSLREMKSEKRDPFILTLYKDLVSEKLLATLPFADRVLAYHELSLDLLRNGRTPEAEKLLLSCEALMNSAESDEKLKSAPLISASLRLLADWWETRGEFKRALDLLDSAKFELQSALSIPDQARLLNDIGWLQYRLGDYEGSMESCRLSLNTLNPNQHPLIVAQALNLMGVVHYNSSRYDEAISYYEQSAQLRERAGDENAMAASINNLALAYQAKANYEKALEHYNTSLKLKRRQHNHAGIAAGYLNLALLYVDMRNFKEAEAKCRESLAVCETLDDAHAQLIPDNYITLGDIALEDGDLKGAEKHYRESLQIAHKMEAINEEMGAYRRLSSIALKQKRYEEARGFANKAFDLVQRIGSKFENAQIEDILGDLELGLDRQAKALKHYEKAAGQFTSLSKYRLAAKVLSKIGLIHAETGNTFEARHYLDRVQDFVRADIGRELPDEYVELQRKLRALPARPQLGGSETQKLLMAFYDLSALTDYATDRREFFNRALDVIKDIVGPNDCSIALKTDRGGFLIIDSSGARQPLSEKSLSSLFKQSMLLGTLRDSRSPDVSDLLPTLETPKGNVFVCIPLKAAGEDLGCLLFYFDKDRLPLSKEDVNFFTWLGRQIATNLMLMLHLNVDFLREEILETNEEPLQTEDEPKHRFETLIGKSESMKKIFRTLEKIKETDSGILILGESGTGKSVLARAIHYRSPRRNHRFQEIHCAQIPFNLLESELFGHEKGAFTGATQRKLGLCEVANGGTLFLDDINVIPGEIQAKLLRFLENKSFIRLGGTRNLAADVRIISASNEDLEALCTEGRFREDLYYRLKVILIDLPPLRERKEDMLAIALDYLKKSCADKGIPLKTLSPDVIQLFERAPWRGNVRELQNILERVVVLSDDTVITPESLPEDFLREVFGTSKQSQRRLDELVDEIIKLGGYSEANPLLPALEALIVKRMVAHVTGKGRAAELLGISKPTLYARLRDFEKLF